MAISASLIARRLGKGLLLSAMAIAAVVGGAAVAIAGASGVLAVALVMFLVGSIFNGVITVSMRSSSSSTEPRTGTAVVCSRPTAG